MVNNLNVNSQKPLFEFQASNFSNSRVISTFNKSNLKVLFFNFTTGKNNQLLSEELEKEFPNGRNSGSRIT